MCARARRRRRQFNSEITNVRINNAARAARHPEAEKKFSSSSRLEYSNSPDRSKMNLFRGGRELFELVAFFARARARARLCSCAFLFFRIPRSSRIDVSSAVDAKRRTRVDREFEIFLTAEFSGRGFGFTAQRAKGFAGIYN